MKYSWGFLWIKGENDFMYGEVKLKTPKGDTLTVPMLANAATLIRYKQLFKTDLLSGIVSPEGNFDTDVISKLAFVLAKQAAKVDMTALNYDQYVEWLEDFDSAAFIEGANEIFSVYIDSKNNSSKAKK